MTHFLKVRDVGVSGPSMPTSSSAGGWSWRRIPAAVSSSSRVSTFMCLRVAAIEATYRDWLARGAHFPTAPADRNAEIRNDMRYPDGYLFEVGRQRAWSGAGSPSGLRRAEAGRTDG